VTNFPDAAISPPDFERLIGELVGPNAAIAVAVSGGADSMALAHLASAWAKTRGTPMAALTVDHDLRKTSAAEAAEVAEWMAGLGVAHTVLTWTGPKPQTGIQAAARDARYALMTGWCRDNGVGTLLVAHHRDDQAETYLMRLNRGSGPNGLAAMSATTERQGVQIVRPLLGVPKSRLVSTCRALGQTWIEDPSNRDPRYARTHARAHLAGQNNAAVIAEKTRGFGIARAARDREIRALLDAAAREYAEGVIRLNWLALAEAPADVGTGALARVLCRVSGATHGPRTNQMAALHRAVCRGLTTTRSLHRCLAVPQSDRHILVCREPRNLPNLPIEPGAQFTWDRRFLVALEPGPKLDGQGGMTVGPLGPFTVGPLGPFTVGPLGPFTVGPLGPMGWKQIRDRARSALPTRMCYAVPALFHQDQVISAPTLGVLGDMGGFTTQFSPTLSLLPTPFGVVSPDETPIFRETKSAKASETPVPAEIGGDCGPFANA
jgi:tRNA(Ile)-lysidine synthase